MDLLELGPDILQCILQMLDCDAICSTATTCHMLQQLSAHPTVLSQLQLGPVEDPAMPDERRRLLARLAAAGNAAACYRLGLIRVYHPLSEGGPGAGLESGIKLLRRAVDIGSVSVRADAAFELWLLTRRLPDSLGHGEALLKLASSSGHNPARFGMHRTSSRDREPEDFNVSVDLAATMCCLSDSLEANPTCPLTTSQCSNPGCGRWGVRARARLTGLVGPPGLPRCQGLHGGHCKTRYCSRFCQAIHWPEHRKECSLPTTDAL